MAAITTVNNPTLLDLAKRLDPKDNIATVVEILNEVNEIIPDIVMVESNMTAGHLVTIRTGLPTPVWTKMNQGVLPTKSTTGQVVYGTGHCEAYSEVDARILELNNNSAAWRLSEDRPHIEGMTQEIASTLIAGDESTAPEEFTGFQAYYNDSSAQTADNIVHGGGSGADNASIWLVCWGENTVHGLYPKGTKMGLQVEDLGMETKENTGGTTNALSRVHRVHYSWRMGLCVKDWRYVVRVANIDKSALDQDIGSGANLGQLMFQAIERIPNTNMGRCAFYMSRFVKTRLGEQHSSAVASSTLKMEDFGGRKITTFHGIPVRRLDVLEADEAAVTGL